MHEYSFLRKSQKKKKTKSYFLIIAFPLVEAITNGPKNI